MNVSKLQNCKRIGSISLNLNESKKKSLDLSINEDINNIDLKKNTARVYFIVVDEEIFKIGGSNCKGGIKGTISPYLSGNSGRPSDRTFGINYLIQKRLSEGSKVEFYCQWVPNIKINTPLLFGSETLESPLTYKTMEEGCLKQYLSHTGGEYPIWNFQEAGRAWPREIQEGRMRLLGKK
jgi:hypothetical protein